MSVRVLINITREVREEDAQRMDEIKTIAKNAKNVQLVLTLPAMI